MAIEFKLPDIGEGVAEGEIVEWKVAVGDVVEEDQSLVEVMTDKATVEIPAPAGGTISDIRYEAGDLVPVGDVILVIDTDGSGAAAPKSEETAAKTDTPTPAPVAPTPAPSAAPMPANPVVAPAASGNGTGKVLATPATRKLARELGVEIGGVAGTGPRGRVTKDDVRSHGTAAPAAPAATHTAAPAAPKAPIAASSDGVLERIPYRGLRRAIGDQMVQSAFTAPHFTLVEEVDMTEVAALRKRSKAEAVERGTKMTYLPFIMKALVAALKQHPTMNSILDEASGEQIVYRDVHIGFALDTDKGLMVPVIHDAHRKNAFELAADLDRLGQAGRDGTASRDELTGSTITITSAGSIGGLWATPIINYPEVAILGVYRIEDRPVVQDGEIVVRKMMYLSITLDHRVVDGAEAARFMNTMKRLLGDPMRLVLEG